MIHGVFYLISKENKNSLLRGILLDIYMIILECLGNYIYSLMISKENNNSLLRGVLVDYTQPRIINLVADNTAGFWHPPN